MITVPTIEIPRLPEETNRAYSARVEYLTLGAGRSFDRLLDRPQSATIAPPTKRRDTLVDWSVRYNWQEHARRYDETLASLAAQAHSEQYRKDLEEHRARYQKAGRDLHAVAQGLMGTLAQSIRGRSIEGKDGKVYTIPAMEMTPNTLAIAARALTIAADLEAHALRIADILPSLTDGHDSE